MAASPANSPPPHQAASDAPFFGGMVGISLFYLFMIGGMLGAMSSYATIEHVQKALSSENILFATKLSLITCTMSTILSLWVAVPIGYLMSRFSFPGKNVVDTLLDIPIILPPLVVGLGLLILFQTPMGRWVEHVTEFRMGDAVRAAILTVVVAANGYAILRLGALVVSVFRPADDAPRPSADAMVAPLMLLMTVAAADAILLATDLLPWLSGVAQRRLATRITHAVPAVVLAQFMVACAFAVRTMRVTFDQIHPRHEQVALTLGASRSQAFWTVVLPEARRGMLAAATLAWARSLGEFGPILVFASATRMRTEVLPTTVWLELQTGSLEAAAVVSLIMVVVAILVLVLARVCGLRKSFA